MRHGKKFNHLGRQKGHREAMLMNMANSLIEHKRITTTLAKAKALRVYVEPIITRGKEDTTHNRRMAFRYLQNKVAVATLFGEVSAKVGDRPGGYTRILRTGFRPGDNAEMCIIELVDFNETYVKEAKAGGTKKRRSRRGSGAAKAGDATSTATAEPSTEEAPAEDAGATEEKKED